MPIPGIVASSISGSKAITGNYYSIATATVTSGGASTITFSSIPSTYTHLQIRVTARTNYANTNDLLYLRFNGVSTNNYSYHYLIGDGSSATAGGYYPDNIVFGGRVAGNNASSNVFGVSVIDILDYTNTSKNKTTRALTGWDNNGSGQATLYSGSLSVNTNAITDLYFGAYYGSTIQQYSSFALYGVK